MLRVRCNTTKLKAKLRDAERRREGGRLAALREGVSPVVRRLAQIARKDTRRYVRGWIIAGNEAGLDRLPVPSVKPSDFADSISHKLKEQEERFVKIEERLRKRVRWWQHRIETWYTSKGRNDKWARGAKQKLRDVEKTLARVVKLRMRAEEEAQKFNEGAEGQLIFFDRRGGRRLIYTVRHKIYGGRGRVIETRDASVVHLTNLEPHTRIVEGRFGTLAEADRLERPAGIRRVRGAYLRRVLVAA